ncbi:ABC transporter ATP-binding protein [Mycoplasma sp. SG1]|uniref:ABC transporter ATP-binding protein n=1 Tax=Mycoplasma sp. SG1 TaxID=2810348 RepID=UPI0020251EEC|nr:ATP-binding cassette domain-containing protein [Mycoplasma sp. SG1]URM53076.1 ATP-binding cassette domain-containing protein [Mycoplasma sp. SG1]
MITINNVTKYFGNIRALNDVTIQIKPGETYALLGKNGAGKTTLFRIIMGLIDPDIGKVAWNDKKITISDLLNVGYVPEVRSLIPQLKVKQQVKYFSSIKGINSADFEKRWDVYADILDLKKYTKTKIKNLSKGNQQKVQLICGIIHDPKLIILDEPFSGLDVINRELIGKVINLLKQKDKILIFSSHLIEDIEKFCESIIMIDEGGIIYQGSVYQIKEEFKKFSILEITFRDVSFVQLNKIADILKKSVNIIDIRLSANKMIIKSESTKDQDLVKAYIFKHFLSYVASFNIVLPSLNEIFVSKLSTSKNEDQNISLEKLSHIKSERDDIKNVDINFLANQENMQQENQPLAGQPKYQSLTQEQDKQQNNHILNQESNQESGDEREVNSENVGLDESKSSDQEQPKKNSITSPLKPVKKKSTSVSKKIAKKNIKSSTRKKTVSIVKKPRSKIAKP